MTSPPADRERRLSGLTNEELFMALASRMRRIVLFHLHQQGVARFDELVDVVYEYTDPHAVVGADDRDRLATTIAEHQLPLMERLELVVYDRLHDTVELGDPPDDLGDWLDLAIRRELRWAETDDRSVEADDEPGPGPGPGPVTVLIVDDEPGLADVIGDFLQTHHDMTAVTATNAPDAFTILDSARVDCIVSDYRMPAIDGLDFLEAVREEHPDLAFVLFTNKGSEDVASEAITHDVNAYVPKGTGTEQYDRLAHHIRRAVDGHENRG